MHFLSDAIDFKQSVEGTFKTVFDEAHFIVDLYSFLPLVPWQTLPPSQAEQLLKLPPPPP